MAYVTTPIPDGWTWTDETAGRNWTTEAASDQLTLTAWEGAVPPLRWDQERWDWSVWGTLVPLGAELWYRSPVTGTWTEIPDRLLAVNTRAGVPLWYQGPRAGSARFTLEQTDSPAPRPALGDDIQVRVRTLSGIHKTLWTGRLASLSDRLSAASQSTLVLDCVDVIGWAYQAGSDTVTAVADLPDTNTGNVLYLLFQATWFADVDPFYLTRVDRSGALSGLPSAGFDSDLEVQVSAGAGQLVRQNLGLLYSDRTGILVFRPANWWLFDLPIKTLAALGTGTPPEDATYQFAHNGVAAVESLIDVRNQVAMTRVDKFNTQQGSTTQTPDAGSLAKYGRRVYTDTTRLSVGADLTNVAFTLKDALETEGRRIVSASFAADVDAQAQEFALAVEPGSLVQVQLDTQAATSWSPAADEWVTAHVTQVQHRLSPGGGWDVSLGLESRTVGLTSIP